MKKFPFYRQYDQMDFGPTSLRMAAKHHGRGYTMNTLRQKNGDIPQVIKSIFFLSCFLILLLSCERDRSSDAGVEITDPFIDQIRRTIPEISVLDEEYLDASSIYIATYLLSDRKCDRLIAIDNATKSITLSDNSGLPLSRAGGEGQGPGEFQSMIAPHIGSDSRLYVIDALTFRISIFDIKGGELNFDTSVSYNNPPEYFLSALYVTRYGNFGVYQQSQGYFTPENRFFLYRLDQRFSPTERLLEMPGHERQQFESPGFTTYTPYKYRSRTIWDIDNEWFYYITTMKPELHKFHLQTGEEQVITAFRSGERPNSSEFTRSVIDFYPPEEQEHWSALADIDHLPLFSDLLVQGNRILLTVMPKPGADGITVTMDQQTEQVKYFRTPQEFVPKSICGDTIFGIDYQADGEYQIMKIELATALN